MQSVTQSNFEERLCGSLADSIFRPCRSDVGLPRLYLQAICGADLVRSKWAPHDAVVRRARQAAAKRVRLMPVWYGSGMVGQWVVLSSALCAVPFGHRVLSRFTFHSILHRLHRSLRCVVFRTEVETVVSESSERAQSVRALVADCVPAPRRLQSIRPCVSPPTPPALSDFGIQARSLLDCSVHSRPSADTKYPSILGTHSARIYGWHAQKETACRRRL
jgi:hypothetical protein